MRNRRGRHKIKKPEQPLQQKQSDGLWSADTQRLIKDGLITPVISNDIYNQLFFGDNYNDQVVSKWATDLKYPWTSQPRITHVAQFARIAHKTGPKARLNYLEHLKYRLLLQADEDERVSDPEYFIASENYENRDYTPTKLARDLGYLDFNSPELANHPLTILAKLPFKIYVTTGYHRLLEIALEQVGRKQPRSAIFPWNDSLAHKLPPFTNEHTTEKLSVNKPLVYYLNGRDDIPESLVITENDYLHVLMKLIQERKSTKTGRHTTDDGKPIIRDVPREVKTALGQNPLLLLGYGLQSWDFRVLFNGLLQYRRNFDFESEGDGICIQYLPNQDEDEETIQKILNEYLHKKSRLKVYWGETHTCMDELYNASGLITTHTNP